MAISPQCLQWYRSSQPNCDGGVVNLLAPIISTDLLVFPLVPQPTAALGVIYYRKIFLKNSSPTLTLFEPRIWIANNPLNATFSFAIGTSSDTTPPAVPFTWTASSTAVGVLIGPDIAPGATLALWVKHDLPINSGTVARNELKIAVQGRTATAGAIKAPEFPFEVLFAHIVEAYLPPSTQPLPNGEIWNYPSWVVDLFLNFLRQFFYSFWDDKYKFYPYADPSKGVHIADQFTRNLLERERRPALITSLEPISRRNLVNDNFLDGFRTKRYADLWRGAITISAFAREGLEAKMLAWIVASAIQKHVPALRLAGLHHVGGISYGKETVVVTDSTPVVPLATVVPVTIEFHFQESWVVKELGGEVLRGISLSISDDQGNLWRNGTDVCTPRADDVQACT